ARCSASVPVRQARMTWIHGQYTGAPPPSQYRPHATRTPRAIAKRPNSSASLVFPIPARRSAGTDGHGRPSHRPDPRAARRARVHDLRTTQAAQVQVVAFKDVTTPKKWGKA